MKRRLFVVPATVIAALLLAGTLSLALAQPGPPDEPPGQAVAAEHRPEHAGPATDTQPGPPDKPPGQQHHSPVDGTPPGHSAEARGRAISEAAHEKAEVENPDGVSISLSLVGFCRSQAPWMSDKGDSCEELADLFHEKPEGDDDNGGASSQAASGTHRDHGRHLGHQRAAELARASLEMARGLFAHVLSLLA